MGSRYRTKMMGNPYSALLKETTEETPDVGPFRDELQKQVELLNGIDEIHAKLDARALNGLGTRLAIVASARLRPDTRVELFALIIHAGRVYIDGMDFGPITIAGDVKDILRSRKMRLHLREKLQELVDDKDRSIIGTLRQRRPEEGLTALDVAVHLSPEHRRQIADHAGQSLVLEVEELDKLAAFDYLNKPQFLAAGGLVMAIDEAERVGQKRIRVTGMVQN